jgi:hypothetical protein
MIVHIAWWYRWGARYELDAWYRFAGRERVSQNSWLLSRRGRTSPANAGSFDTHRDSITSRLDCRIGDPTPHPQPPRPTSAAAAGPFSGRSIWRSLRTGEKAPVSVLQRVVDLARFCLGASHHSPCLSLSRARSCGADTSGCRVQCGRDTAQLPAVERAAPHRRACPRCKRAAAGPQQRHARRFVLHSGALPLPAARDNWCGPPPTASVVIAVLR